ncbi:hypothetical protein B0H11DRAFT_2257374 [Mycena galericulata]|nr:hypothetical protein B0H11DRAFT_2257374 [Mycena galericulata]
MSPSIMKKCAALAFPRTGGDFLAPPLSALLYIAALKTYAPLAAQLLADALVSSVLLDRCRHLTPHLDQSKMLVVVDSAGGLAWRMLWRLFVNPGANDITVRTPFISTYVCLPPQPDPQAGRNP